MAPSGSWSCDLGLKHHFERTDVVSALPQPPGISSLRKRNIWSLGKTSTETTTIALSLVITRHFTSRRPLYKAPFCGSFQGHTNVGRPYKEPVSVHNLHTENKTVSAKLTATATPGTAAALFAKQCREALWGTATLTVHAKRKEATRSSYRGGLGNLKSSSVLFSTQKSRFWKNQHLYRHGGHRLPSHSRGSTSFCCCCPGQEHPSSLRICLQLQNAERNFLFWTVTCLIRKWKTELQKWGAHFIWGDRHFSYIVEDRKGYQAKEIVKPSRLWNHHKNVFGMVTGPVWLVTEGVNLIIPSASHRMFIE